MYKLSLVNNVIFVVVLNFVLIVIADIDPSVVHYNPVAAVIEPDPLQPNIDQDLFETNVLDFKFFNPKVLDQNFPPKQCPGALVWVGPRQIFIASSSCAPGVILGKVRAGGNETRGILWSQPNNTLGVGIVFLTGDPIHFQVSPLVIPGYLLKHEHEARTDLPITISRSTWGPHHEIPEVEGKVKFNEFMLNFTEKLTEGKCPEEAEWGPAMRPALWNVPLIVGVFKKYASSRVDDGLCKVSLVYTRIATAVEWIEKTVDDDTQKPFKKASAVAQV